MSITTRPEQAPSSELVLATAIEAPLVPNGRQRNRLVGGLIFFVSRPALLLSCVVVGVVAGWVIAPGLFAPGDPLRTDVASALRPPSFANPFGTDELGRDLYTRVVHGARLSLGTAFVAVAIGNIIGTLIGLTAGYLGGVFDSVLMRLLDVILSIPGLLLAMALVTALGFGSLQLSIAVGVILIAGSARIMRSEVLRVKNLTFVDAGRAVGAHPARLLLRHVLPNAIAPVLVTVVLEFGAAILIVASLSFLGFGTPPPAPEWGSLVAQGQSYIAVAWWTTAMPGITIALLVVALNRISAELSRIARRAR